MNARLLTGTALLAGLALAACNEHPLVPITDSIVAEVNETSEPLSTNEVDILWLVDSSGSMEEEQAELGARFDEFIQTLSDLNADFHMAVVTTDTSNAQDAGRFNTSPGRLKSLNCRNVPDELSYCDDLDLGQPFLQRTDYGALGEPLDVGALASDFRCIASAGSCDSGFEQGLTAIERALSPDLLNGPHAGFLREDAFLLVIILSDEDDCSNGDSFNLTRDEDCYAAERRDDLIAVSSVYERLIEVKIPSEENSPGLSEEERRREGERRVLVAGIIGSDDQRDPLPLSEIDCPGCWPQYSCIQSLGGQANGVEAVDGERYRELIELAGSRGVEESICQGTFASALDRIGDILRENLDLNCLVRQPRTCDSAADCLPGVDCINPGDPTVGEKYCADFEVRLSVQINENAPFEDRPGPGAAGLSEALPDADYTVDYDAVQSCANGVAFAFAPNARPPSGARYRASYPVEAQVRDALDPGDEGEVTAP